MDANPNMDTDPDFPRMFYRYPGVTREAAKLQDGTYDTLIVNDADEAAAALAESWFATSPEARASGDEQIAAAAAVAKAASDAQALADAQALVDAAAASTKPPTRAEMEQKATDLGIAFKPGWSDKKLADQIAASLEE